MKQLKQETIDDLVRDEMKKVTDPTKMETLWDDFRWEVKYYWERWFYYPYRNIINGIDNFVKYRSIIWKDRWWDHEFFFNLMLFKLKDMEERWGKDTHYVGDLDDKEILKKLIEDLEWMITADEFNKGYTEEYKKRSKAFFGRLDRHHRKFWDQSVASFEHFASFKQLASSQQL